LSNNQLIGIIPSTLGNLSHLKALSMDSNRLAGTIPSTLGNLQQLFYIDLYNNTLTGTIPSQWCNYSITDDYSILSGIAIDCDEMTCSCCEDEQSMSC
jgi:hypothetical protein